MSLAGIVTVATWENRYGRLPLACYYSSSSSSLWCKGSEIVDPPITVLMVLLPINREMGAATLERMRRQFVVEGLEPRKQAFVVALAYTKSSEGRHRWKMQFLADRHFPNGIPSSRERSHPPRPDASSGSSAFTIWQFTFDDAYRKSQRLYPS